MRAKTTMVEPTERIYEPEIIGETEAQKNEMCEIKKNELAEKREYRRQERMVCCVTLFHGNKSTRKYGFSYFYF